MSEMINQVFLDKRLSDHAWVLGDPTDSHMQRIPDEIRDCTSFLCVRQTDGTYHYGGTGFFISVPSLTVPEDHSQRCEYFVTAKHNVEKAKNYGSLFMRANTRDGKSKAFP